MLFKKQLSNAHLKVGKGMCILSVSLEEAVYSSVLLLLSRYLLLFCVIFVLYRGAGFYYIWRTEIVNNRRVEEFGEITP